MNGFALAMTRAGGSLNALMFSAIITLCDIVARCKEHSISRYLVVTNGHEHESAEREM